MPGATKFGLSFSLFRFTMATGFVEIASAARRLSKSKSDVKATISRGFLMNSSVEAPLEITIEMWKPSAIATSLRRLDRSLILAGPSKVSKRFMSISNELKALEASSASALSKNLFRGL